MKRFWALTLTGAALLVAGYMHGSVAWLFENDQSRISVVLLGFTIWGTALIGLGNRDAAAFIAKLLPRGGIIGTVIGLLITLASVDPAAISNIDSVVSVFIVAISGMSIAFITTLVGLAGNLWLVVVLRLT